MPHMIPLLLLLLLPSSSQLGQGILCKMLHHFIGQPCIMAIDRQKHGLRCCARWNSESMIWSMRHLLHITRATQPMVQQQQQFLSALI